MSFELYDLKSGLDSDDALEFSHKAILYDKSDTNKLIHDPREKLNHFVSRSVGLDAPYSYNGIHTFRVTHPFHPLYGQEYEIIKYKRIQARDRIFFHQKDGSIGSLPLAWCDLRPPDPYLDMMEKQSPFRVEDLLKLSDIIKEVKR